MGRAIASASHESTCAAASAVGAADGGLHPLQVRLDRDCRHARACCVCCLHSKHLTCRLACNSSCTAVQCDMHRHLGFRCLCTANHDDKGPGPLPQEHESISANCLQAFLLLAAHISSTAAWHPAPAALSAGSSLPVSPPGITLSTVSAVLHAV